MGLFERLVEMLFERASTPVRDVDGVLRLDGVPYDRQALASVNRDGRWEPIGPVDVPADEEPGSILSRLRRVHGGPVKFDKFMAAV